MSNGNNKLMVSDKVVIITKEELRDIQREQYELGVQRGKSDTHSLLNPKIAMLERRIRELKSDRAHKDIFNPPE